MLADIMRQQPDFWISRQEWEEDPNRALKKCGTLANQLLGLSALPGAGRLAVLWKPRMLPSLAPCLCPS